MNFAKTQFRKRERERESGDVGMKKQQQRIDDSSKSRRTQKIKTKTDKDASNTDTFGIRIQFLYTCILTVLLYIVSDFVSFSLEMNVRVMSMKGKQKDRNDR